MDEKRLAPSISELAGMLADCRSVQDLCDRSLALFGNPMIVFDDSRHVVGCTVADIDDEQYRHLLKNRFPSRDLTENLDWRRLMADFHRKPGAFKHTYRGVSHIIKTLFAGGQFVGQIDIAEHFRPLSDEDVSLAEIIAYPATALLLEAALVRSPRSSELDYFLEYLLDGHELDESSARSRAGSCGWAIGSVCLVLVSDVFGIDAKPPAVLFDGLLSKSDKIMRYRDFLIAILSRESDVSEEEFLWLGNALASRGIVCGLSEPFSKISSLLAHFRQAAQALDVGRRVDGHAWLYRYSDFLEYAIIAEYARTNDPAEYLSPGILRLIETDRGSGLSLLITLRAWLYSGRSLSEAAAALHVHPNTVLHRVRKALEIVGVQAQDGKRMIQLAGQLHLLEYLDREKYFS